MLVDPNALFSVVYVDSDIENVSPDHELTTINSNYYGDIALDFVMPGYWMNLTFTVTDTIIQGPDSLAFTVNITAFVAIN